MADLSLMVTVVLAVVTIQKTSACYQECSAIFNHKIQQLVGLQDQAELSQRSCQAMSEQMTCLEGKKATCDATSLQYVTSILNFIRPDYERTCSQASGDSNGTNTSTTSTQVMSAEQLMTQCTQEGNQCYVTFNVTYAPAVVKGLQNMTAICQSLENYTSCLESLLPQCGPFIGRAVNSIRVMQQQYSYVCSAGISVQTMRECVNGTMGCYASFNQSFLPAVNQYNMASMCSAMDNYSSCLTTLHQRTECQRFTQQALAGLITLKRQYSMYCGEDGGQQTQKCVTDFQTCYESFNLTYFPAVHSGNMKGICSSVQQYYECVQPVARGCGPHMAQALNSVRVLKEQFALQCHPEFQKLTSCRPLMGCLNHFATALPTARPTSVSLCTSLETYFPCVERGLEQCKIPASHTHIPFSQLGTLTSAYCKNLLANSMLNKCPSFLRCTSGILLVLTPDPSAMFDAATWCTFMDASLSCVERAINTPSCGMEYNETIKGHLTQQRAMKRDVCKMAPVPSLTTASPNEIPAEFSTDKSSVHTKQHTDTSDLNSAQEGTKAGHGDSGTSAQTPRVLFLAVTAVVSLMLPFLS